MRAPTAADRLDLEALVGTDVLQRLEFIRPDECVEVTPESVRLRKVLLSATDRVKASRVAAKASD